MNTKALNSLADLICRAQEQDRTPMGIALAVDAAGRHMSPEVAQELAALRVEVAALREERHSTNTALADTTVAQRADRDRIAELEHLVQQMCDGLNGHDCPPPDEMPMQTVTRAAVRLMEAERQVSELEAWKAADEEAQQHREATAAANLRIVAKLQTRIRRVRFLHTKRADSDHCEHDGEAWPCPTLAALDAAVGVAPTRTVRPEGEFYAAVHHPYRVGRDLPELGGQR